MAAENYYTPEDYYSVEKIDAHVHYNTRSANLLHFAERHRFRLLSINTKIPGFPSITEQQQIVQSHPLLNQSLFYLTSFDADDVMQGRAAEALEYVSHSIKAGALGFKVWKDIGMVIRDDAGQFIFIDDKRFAPFFDWAERYNVPVLGHIGEPKNCWLPVEEMTVNNDKNYFRGHPEYHMHLHPEYPAYETLTDSYANMLSHHPELHYVGAHFGSLEWSVAEVGKRLNTFPYMAVDMAERIGHIHYQTLRNREEVRNFFIKYQDRIIYGTDLIIDETIAADALQDKAGRLWLEDWKFLTTDEEMRSPYVDGAFKGLKLPAAVIDKVYRLNAEKWYRMPPR